MKSKIYALAAIAGLSLAAAGCTTSVSTRTDRTAVEMALISRSAERTVESFTVPADMAGTKFFIKTDEFKAVDQEWSLSQIRRLLLNGGMNEVAEDDADVVIIPSAAIAAMDEASFLIGVPSLPIPVPNVGSIKTPEIALLGRQKQMGLTRLGIYAMDKEDGSMAHDFGTESAQNYYSRWTVLFFISFSVTDLDEPHRDRTERDAKRAEKRAKELAKEEAKEK